MFNLKNRKIQNGIALACFSVFGILITHDMTPRQYDVLLNFGPKAYVKKIAKTTISDGQDKLQGSHSIIIDSDTSEQLNEFSMNILVAQE